MLLLQGLRDWWDAPLKITSGFRSWIHNDAIGGAMKSQHMTFASDVQPSLGSVHLNPYQESEKIKQSLVLFSAQADAVGFDGIGMYDTFVHLDLRGKTARWDNRTDAA